MNPTVGQASFEPAPEREPIFAQAERILESPAFRKSQRRRDLLTWLVRLTLEGRADEISERRIAAEVFGRSGDFEPTEDSIVRVEIRRLRSSLESYYSDEGRDEELLILFPKGCYAPVFIRRGTRTAVAGEEANGTARSPEPIPWNSAQAETEGEPPAVQRVRFALSGRRWLGLAGAVLGALTVGAIFKGTRTPELVPVTALPGRQVQPSISPDGSRVAFAWDAEGDGSFQLFVKPLRGEAIRRLTSGPAQGRSPAWSPDGRTIAYLRTPPDLPQEVRLISPDGGPERVLTTIRTKVTGLAWTPDSLNLIVPDCAPESSGDTRLALFLVSIATGERHRLTEYGSFFEPDVSPDGRTLVFATDTEPGGNTAVCLMPLGRDFSPRGAVRVLHETAARSLWWPTWTTDGHALVYGVQRGGRWSIFRIPSSGGNSQRVGGAGEGVAFGREFARGKMLLVRRREQVFLAKAGGENPGGASRPLFLQSLDRNHDGALSPDGLKVAFISERDGRWGLWVAHADGTGAVEVEVPTGLQPRAALSWTPDGQSLFFCGVRIGPGGGRARILRANVSTSTGQASPIQAVPVQLDDADDIWPIVSRDGRRLYFTSRRAEQSQIRRSPISGGASEAVGSRMEGTNVPMGEESVDGEYFFYTSGSGIRRQSVRTGKDELYLPVAAATLRVGVDGVYYDTAMSNLAGVVWFRPFAAGSAPVKIAIGQYRSWSPIPGRHGLLASLARQESNIEVYVP